MSVISKRCFSCRAESPSALKCGRCRGVRYCNAECQRRDWPNHKQVCTHIRDAHPGKEGKRSIYSFVEELKGTALHTQLSALKNYAIKHGIGKGLNAFVVDEITDGFGHAVKECMGLSQDVKVYHLYTEWITSEAFPREYTTDKLNIAVGRDRDGTGSPSVSLMDDYVPLIISELIAVTLMGSHDVLRTFFSSKATLPNPWVLMVPRTGKLYLLRMTIPQDMTIRQCGSIPLPGSLI